MAQAGKPVAQVTAEDVGNEFVNKVKGIKGVSAVAATVHGTYIVLTTLVDLDIGEDEFDRICQAELETGDTYDGMFALEFQSITLPPSCPVEDMIGGGSMTKILYRRE